MGREKVFPEKALAEAEVAREFTLRDKDAVEPVEGAGAVLDAMSGDGVIGHDFGGTVVSIGVNLGKNDSAVGGGLEPVGVDELAELSGREVKPAGEETEERGLFGLQGERRAGKQSGGNGGKGNGFVFRRRGNGGNRRRSDAETAEVVEVLARGVVVTTGFGTLATAYLFVEEVTGEGVNVADKTVGGSASRTGEAGGHAVVGLEFVTVGVVHGLGVLKAFVLGRGGAFDCGEVEKGTAADFHGLDFTGVDPCVDGGKGDVEFRGDLLTGEVAFFVRNETVEGAGDGFGDGLGNDLF